MIPESSNFEMRREYLISSWQCDIGKITTFYIPFLDTPGKPKLSSCHCHDRSLNWKLGHGQHKLLLYFVLILQIPSCRTHWGVLTEHCTQEESGWTFAQCKRTARRQVARCQPALMSNKHIEWMWRECAHSAPICHQFIVHDVQNFVVVLPIKAEMLLQIYRYMDEKDPSAWGWVYSTCLKSLMQLWQQKRFCCPSTSRKWLADARLGR